MGKLFEELKRRKVFRVAAVYAVVSWVLIQVMGFYTVWTRSGHLQN